MTRLLAIAAYSVLAGISSAADFSISTKIFVEEADVPAAEHRVLFVNGLAYDISLTDDRFSTIYDAANGKVVLLDRKSEVQTVVELEDLLRITAEAKASIRDADDRKRLGLSAQVVSENGYSIEFAGTEYWAQTETPSDPSIATDYGRFADLALRMNIVRPSGPPPFARMTLNSHIAAKGEVPIESKLKIDRGGQSVSYRSTNQIGELIDADRQRIEQIQADRSGYRLVPRNEFPAP